MSGVLVIGMMAAVCAAVGMAWVALKLTTGGVKWLCGVIRHEMMMQPQGRYYRMEVRL